METLRLGDLRLQTVQELGRVSVVADGWNRERLEFEERRKFHFQGTFFDDEELARVPIITGAVLGAKVPRSKAGGDMILLERNLGWCVPRLVVDGVDYGNKTMGEWKTFLPLAKRVEVYRAAFAPPRYTDFDGCGVVVVSTR